MAHKQWNPDRLTLPLFLRHFSPGTVVQLCGGWHYITSLFWEPISNPNHHVLQPLLLNLKENVHFVGFRWPSEALKGLKDPFRPQRAHPCWETAFQAIGGFSKVQWAKKFSSLVESRLIRGHFRGIFHTMSPEPWLRRCPWAIKPGLYKSRTNSLFSGMQKKRCLVLGLEPLHLTMTRVTGWLWRWLWRWHQIVSDPAEVWCPSVDGWTLALSSQGIAIIWKTH